MGNQALKIIFIIPITGRININGTNFFLIGYGEN